MNISVVPDALGYNEAPVLAWCNFQHVVLAYARVAESDVSVFVDLVNQRPTSKLKAIISCLDPIDASLQSVQDVSIIN